MALRSVGDCKLLHVKVLGREIVGLHALVYTLTRIAANSHVLVSFVLLCCRFAFYGPISLVFLLLELEPVRALIIARKSSRFLPFL